MDFSTAFKNNTRRGVAKKKKKKAAATIGENGEVLPPDEQIGKQAQVLFWRFREFRRRAALTSTWRLVTGLFCVDLLTNPSPDPSFEPKSLGLGPSPFPTVRNLEHEATTHLRGRLRRLLHTRRPSTPRGWESSNAARQRLVARLENAWYD